MEGLILLLIIWLVLALIVFPLVLFLRTRRLAQRAEQLESRLAEMETRMRRLSMAGTAAGVEEKQEEGPAMAAPSAEPPPKADKSVAPPVISPAPPAAPIEKERPALETAPAFAQTAATNAEAPLARETFRSAAQSQGAPESICGVTPPPIPPRKTGRSFDASKFDWEQFMGVKLFAWIGGLAAFLGVAFFLKYSFEHNLIPPEVRVAVGFLAGVGLLIGGIKLSRKAYPVMSQTLCATGVVVLYAVTFACRAIYHFSFFGVVPTFLMMILITTVAFLLAARLNAMVVAILGMLGGFLTPVLLSTGQDNPLGLFGYIALLDAGLVAVALNRRWNFLVTAAAVGTALMQAGWALKFFEPAKIFVAMGVFLGFCGLFLAAFAAARKRGAQDVWFSVAALLAPSVAYCFALTQLGHFGDRPAVLFSFIFVADLVVLTLVLLEARLYLAHLVAGGATFVFLAAWTAESLTNGLLYWALGLYLFFAILHSIFPIVLRRLRPEAKGGEWMHLFPAAALLLILLPIFKLPDISMVVWPCVLLIDLLAVGMAVLTATLVPIIVVLLLTVLAAACWLANIPAELTGAGSPLLVVGGFAVVFLLLGLYAVDKILAKIGGETSGKGSFLGSFAVTPETAGQLPAMAVLLPFVLLILLTARLSLTDPSPVFGLALLLIVLALGVAWKFKIDWLPAAALGGVLALEHVWHSNRFQPGQPWALAWPLIFYAVFSAYPFVFRKKFENSIVPWATAALAGPLHFYLVHDIIRQTWPNDFMGLVPAAFALPPLAGLAYLLKTIPRDNRYWTARLAWFGGASLFFITLIFPVQFDRQWITLGWALEGAALLWLFHRVPHPGLRLTGAALLVVAFARLALNPAVLSYHPRSATPILNWYFYTYGIAAVCMFAGARLLAPPRNKILGQNAPPLFYTLGTILLFLLLNIEIADFFSEGSSLMFQFSGNFARDMSYTVAWALFAFGLLLIGVLKQLRPVRYASLALLGVTLLKLFFHDLANLGQLYRVAALISVAIILWLASVVYQKFLSKIVTNAGTAPGHETSVPNKP